MTVSFFSGVHFWSRLHSSSSTFRIRTSMPLDSNPVDNDHDLNSLRVSLIGNRDLKFKLIRDVSFVESIVSEFEHHVKVITAHVPERLSLVLGNLDTKTVILKILTVFLNEISFKQKLEIQASVTLFDRLLQPTYSLISYFVGVVIPYVYRLSSPLAISQLEKSVEFSLDIILSLYNERSYGVTFDSNSGVDGLWKLATTAMVVSDPPVEVNGTPLINSNIFGKLLQLIPLLLTTSKDTAATHKLTVALLSTLLRRLEAECVLIFAHHFPGVSGLSFKESVPDIEPNYDFLRTKANIKVLTDLVTSTAQVFSHLRAADQNVLMVTQTEDIDNQTATTVVLPLKVYWTLLLTLKYDDRRLNMAALNLVNLYLNNVYKSGSSKTLRGEVMRNYRRIFPRIIELLDLEKPANTPYVVVPQLLELPAKILCTLCMTSRFARDELRRCNVDYKIIRNLSTLIKSDTSLENMNTLKKLSANGTKLVDFTSLLDLEASQKHQNANLSRANLVSKTKAVFRTDQLEMLGDYFLLLSVYVGDKEEYRYRIVEYKDDDTPKHLLAQLTFELIDNYRFLLLQVQIIYKILHNKQNSNLQKEDLLWFGKNLGIIFSLIGHDFYFSVLHLIRSLSRSVSTLRTFFVECNSYTSILDITGEETSDTNSDDGHEPIFPNNVRYHRETGLPVNGSFITNILQILLMNEELNKIIEFFWHIDENVYKDTRRFLKYTNPLNKSIVLATIANFVLDFSSFRYDVVNDSEFLRNLISIYENAQRDSQTADRTERLQHHTIQLTVLQILKNYSFNENQENKKELLEYIPISIIFDKSMYGLNGIDADDELKEVQVKQKILAFDVLRNLTAGSLYFSEKMREFYVEYLHSRSDLYPQDWTEYLITNMLSFELFVDFPPNHNVLNKLTVFNKDDELLGLLVLNENYVKFITSLNYIEDHRYTNIANFKMQSFPSERILFMWKRFLTLRITPLLERKLTRNDINLRIELNNNLNEIRLSIVWILINLTFKNDDFGYHQENFRIYDVIRNPDAAPPRPQRRSSSINSQRIVIDDSDEETAPESETKPFLDDQQLRFLSPHDRAQILHDLGFSEALDRLHLYLLSSVRDEGRNRKKAPFTIKRFDELNNHGLLEKVKTANSQISMLVRLEQQYQNPLHHQIRRRSSNVITSTGGPQPSTSPRRPVIYSGSVSGALREAGRGGEGFGYNSDDEVIAEDNEEAVDSGSDETHHEEDDYYDNFPDDYWVN